MKVILEFNLPDDNDDWEMHKMANDMWLALWDFDMQYLRNQIKHNPDNLTEKQLDAVERVRDKLHEILSERNVDLDRVS